MLQLLPALLLLILHGPSMDRDVAVLQSESRLVASLMKLSQDPKASVAIADYLAQALKPKPLAAPTKFVEAGTPAVPPSDRCDRIKKGFSHCVRSRDGPASA